MLRYHPSDPRSCLEGYEGSLTSDEEAALEQLHSEAADLDLKLVTGDYGAGFEGGDHAVEPSRLCLLRFLRGNAFSVSKALSQLKACVEHRVHHPTDKLLSSSPRALLQCDVEEFDSFYPRWLMGYDRLGRPIIATQYGSLRLWEMVKLTTLERMGEVHAREQELLMRLLRRRTLEGGGIGGGREGADSSEGGSDRGVGGGGDSPRYIVDTVVIVVDTAGLTLRHVTKEFVRLFKMRSQVDQLLFPEMMGKLLIVNTPSLFSYVWAMFSPMVDERTRSKIAIIARPDNWKLALREIADDDQLSPEYGGTGSSQAELPSLADALYAAGCRGGSGNVNHRSPATGGQDVAESGVARALARSPTHVLAESRGESGEEGAIKAAGVETEENRRTRFSFVEASEAEEKEESDGGGRKGWFGAVWGALGWWWSGGGGGGGGGDVSGGVVDSSGSSIKRDREMSGVTLDEEFFDAMAELDHESRLGWEDQGAEGAVYQSSASGLRNRCFRSSSRQSRMSRESTGAYQNDVERGNDMNNVWRRSWGGTSPEVTILDTSSVRGATARQGYGEDAARGKPRWLSAAVAWCCRPVLRRLEQRGIDQLACWLCAANAVSVLLAIAFVVVGASSLSTSWLGAVLGWQWGAITAVCLGCLMLLLALMGTAGARLRNRFTLLGFTALEGTVAFGTLLSGVWCLALAGGSTTVSDLTWEAMDEQRNTVGTKEAFLNGARDRLVVLGATGVVLSLFSVAGPCLLAWVLSGKIQRLEENGAIRDAEKRFGQLRRSFQETNALCTAFACVCTGYGGYALSFTISLGLAASVTSTYLMVASGYFLLLAGAVGAWAAASARPDAFRLHFGSLFPAGVLYASLTVVQLISARLSNDRVEQAWPELHPDGANLYNIQARVRTMLIVGGVLSAVTFVLVVASAVTSWVARKELISLVGHSWRTRNHSRAKLARGEALSAIWALALAATSTFFDGSFAVFSAWLARNGDQAMWLVAFWRAMGRGDRRYVEGDTFVVATAIIVAAVIGPGAMLYAWAVYCRKDFRFSVGILVCTASVHTQVLRFVTSPGSLEAESSSGGKAVFIAASVVLALLQVAGALAVLLYNVRRMTKRVHAAEVQYRALLLEHDRLAFDGVDGKRESKRESGDGHHGTRRGKGRESCVSSKDGGRVTQQLPRPLVIDSAED